MLVEHRLAGVAAIEGVQRGGAELQPQRDEAGDADDPGEQRHPAVPVAGPAEPAKQADSLTGSLPGMRGARRAGVRHGDLPRAEERLLLPILAVTAAKVVLRGEAPARAATPRAYSAGSTRPPSTRLLRSLMPPGYDRRANRSWTAGMPAPHRGRHEHQHSMGAVMSKELLIKGGHVVTVDPDLGDLPVGDVLVTDGVITAVGPDLAPTTTAAEVIEAAGRLVIPGMVDTHRHVWQGAIGGYTPQITGAGYGPAVLTGISLKHSPEDVYAGTMWGALQALDAGITTIADWAHNDQSPAHADADLRGLRDSGIRGYFLYGGPGPATGDPNPPHPADARRMRDQYFASGTYGRLRMGMALRGPCFTSAERNAEDYAFARDLGLPISVHVGMAGTADAVTTLQRYRLLGADVNYVHGNMLTDREFDLIAETQGTVTITPSTDMLMQFGTFPATGPALSRGIVSGFGIDTICSAGNDLFSEMRLALAAERSRANAPALASGKQVPTVDLHQRDMLRLATIDGARVWRLDDEIGTLTPGKQADIAIIDMRSPHLDGFGDPVAVMVLGAGPADVETVIIGGDVVKRDGKLTGDHVDHALELMHAARERLRA